ncbi:MAG: hypothetical protein WCR34_04845 [Bacilli bacterium]
MAEKTRKIENLPTFLPYPIGYIRHPGSNQLAVAETINPIRRLYYDRRHKSQSHYQAKRFS